MRLWQVCNLSSKSETHQFPWYFINRRGISHPCRNVSILRRKKIPKALQKINTLNIFELSKKNSRQFFTFKPPKFQKVGQSTPNKKSYSSKTLLFEWETKISFPTTSLRLRTQKCSLFDSGFMRNSEIEAFEFPSVACWFHEALPNQ